MILGRNVESDAQKYHFWSCFDSTSKCHLKISDKDLKISDKDLKISDKDLKASVTSCYIENLRVWR